MKKIILTLLVIFWTNTAFAKIKQLQCDLILSLGKPSKEQTVNISYDEKAFNSNEPVVFTLNDIEFVGERKTSVDSSILSVDAEIVEAEKMISNIYHTFDYAVEEKLLVYTKIKKKDPNKPSINMYQCE